MANTCHVLAILFYASISSLGASAASANAEPLSADQTAYLAELMTVARDKNLAHSRDWQLLLHYTPTLLGRVMSRADGPAFFLSPEGKTNPQAELDATLGMFFTDDAVGRTKQPAQCAFPDRYQWLKQQLAFDSARLPDQRCERLDRWLAEINPAGVTLIFPSAYMNNPSSMFGHTLLRIDQRGQTPDTGILAYVINYAADADTDNPALYAIRGVIGSFKGYFATMPYYIKIQEYSDMENRDIWEYRLNFNEAKVRRLLLHAWALGNTWFDYYYFKENCSYHLLTLLEIADSTLHLTDHFWAWTIPVDTVRLIAEQPGLVAETTFRPSALNKIEHKRALLRADERPVVSRLITDPASNRSERFRQLPVDRQALLLDLASDYLQYRQADHPDQRAALEPQQRTLLTARSELKIPSEEIVTPSSTGPPEIGHATARAGVAAGVLDNETFEELNIRAGYHDLLDDPAGYLPTAQIEALALRLRHYNTTDRNRIEAFTLLNILSLSPVDGWFASPSWKINAGFESVKERHCGNCNAVNVNVGGGAAVEADLLVHEVLYAFAEADASAGNAYEHDHRIGGGGTVGLLISPLPRWTVHATVTALSFPLGERSSDVRSSLQQRLTLTKNLALRLDLERRDGQDEATITLHYYF
jgi:hypothetical protein